MKRNPLKYITNLGAISFLTGYALMAYELVAARILAPTLGSSIYVWTSVIGMIIAALSLGYWVGGKLADARQKPLDIVILCLASAAGVVLTIISHEATLAWIATSVEDVRLQGVIASLILFVPTSFIIGCTSPYLAKLNIKTLKTAGESVANLSALNSIGGIVGTFTTGFIMFSYIGSNESLIVVTAILLISSWLIIPKQFVMPRIITTILLIIIALVPYSISDSRVANIDTPSAHYQVAQYTMKDKTIYGLSTGPGGLQSAVYPDDKDTLVFWYTNFGSKVIESQQPKNVLVLGGGAFTVPQTLAKSLPNSTIDAVEIDPALESIAKEYFHYESPNNVNLIFEDARTYVNTTNETYDAIFVDVFGDNTSPFSMLTKEYSQQIEKILKPNGIVVINAITGHGDECKELFGAIDSTYRRFLPNGYWATETNQPLERGNYILVYTNSPKSFANTLNTLPDQQSTLYTDNFMPAEKLHYQCQQAR